MTTLLEALQNLEGRDAGRLGEYLNKTFDAGSHAIQAMDRFHYETHRGYCYAIVHEFSLTDTTAQYATITVGDEDIHMQDRFINCSSSDMILELYLNPTVTVGGSPAAITPRRFALGLPNEPNTTVTTVTTVQSFTGGEIVDSPIIYGEVGVGGKSTGSGSTSNRELNFPAGSVIGVKAQRRSGSGAAKLQMLLGYYRIVE